MKKKILFLVVLLVSSVGMTYAMEGQEAEESALNYYDVCMTTNKDGLSRLQGYFREMPFLGCYPRSSGRTIFTSRFKKIQVGTEEFRKKVAIFTNGFDLYPHEKTELEELGERQSLDELLEKVREFQASGPFGLLVD